MKINTSKFDLICNTVDNGIILINKDLEVFFWNKWLEIRTGITIDDIKNKNLIDFYPNINKSKLQRKITTALKLNSPTFYTPQISEFLFNIELAKVADKVFDSMQQSITITPFDVENELLIIYIYDVTLLSEINFKLKNMKEEVEEKNEELKLILDTTMEGIIIFKDGKIIDCNKITIELLNKSSKLNLLNLTLADIITDEKVLKNLNNNLVETIIHKDDGTSFQALINMKKRELNSQNFEILTFIDITEVKRKDNMLYERSKLAAMGEMIGNIAHQWRQPLNMISLATSSIKFKNELDMLDGDFLNEALDRISNTTEHLSNTIEVFRNFLKENKEKSLFSLSENIKNVYSLINPVISDHEIKVIFDLNDDIYVYNYSNELTQALINILNNACDAINMKLKNNEPRLIKISTEQIEDKIIISIIDNAEGIDSKIINKIFEPYFTTKHKYQGTGLGLYMTHEIIERSMNGSLEVSNDKFTYKNQTYYGACFKIILSSKS